MKITITANNYTVVIMCWAQFQTQNPQPCCLSIHKIKQFLLPAMMAIINIGIEGGLSSCAVYFLLPG